MAVSIEFIFSLNCHKLIKMFKVFSIMLSTLLKSFCDTSANFLTQFHIDRVERLHNGASKIFESSRLLITPHRKKSGGVKSGERAGHSIGPRRPIHLPSKLVSNHSRTFRP